MKKLVKFALILAGVFILLLGATAAYITVKYPPEKIKAIAVAKLSESLKRPVSLGGAKFNILSGFVLTDLKIGNRPGWAAGNMVAAKDISISYHLYELILGYFSNRIILGEIKLNEPQILVERRGLDLFNFSDIMEEGEAASAAAPAPAPKPAAPKGKPKAKPAPKKKHLKKAGLPAPAQAPAYSSWFADQAWAESPAPKPASSSMLVSIDSIAINHGKVIYLDEMANPDQRSDLKDLNLKIKNISMTGGKTTFSLKTPFDYSGMKYDLAIEGVFRYFQSGKSLKGMDVKGTVNGLGFGFSGDALDMAGNFAPDIKGEASLNMLQFSGLLPKSLSKMPEGLSLTGPAQVTFHVGGKIRNGLEMEGLADGSALAIKYKDLFVKTAKSVCKVDFKSVRGADGSFDVPAFKVLYSEWEVNGAFHYKNGAPWSCEVHSKSLPFKGLPGMLPKLKDTTLVGGGSLDLSIGPGKGAMPINLNGKAVLKGVGLSLPQESYFQDMNGPINITDNVARMPSMTFKAFEGSNALGVTLNGNTEAYGFAFNLKNVSGQKAINYSMDAFVTKNPAAYKDMLFGSLNMAFQGSGHGFSSAQMQSSLVGSGTFNILDAKIKGISMIKLLNSLCKDPSDELRTERIDGDLSIKNQIVTYNAHSTDKVANNRIHGAINFSAVYAPEMRIESDIKKEYANLSKIQSLLPGIDLNCAYNPDGTLPFDMRLTGPASQKPGFEAWDRGRLERNIGECVKKKAGQAIQEKGQQLLKGLFGK